jgi:hypothetical protein
MMVDNPPRLLAVFANSIRTPFARRALLTVGLLITSYLFLYMTFLSDGRITNLRVSADSQDLPGITKAFVVSSMKKDSTQWVEQFRPGWTIYRYVTDDPHAKYTVPRNKGREAMVYLTFVSPPASYLSLPQADLP